MDINLETFLRDSQSMSAFDDAESADRLRRDGEDQARRTGLKVGQCPANASDKTGTHFSALVQVRRYVQHVAIAYVMHIRLGSELSVCHAI